MQYIEAVVMAVLDSESWKATKYVSDKLVITATQRRYKRTAGTIHGSRTRADIVLTIGRPNYLQRMFIKNCKLAGETFPVKKIQLKALPATRAKRKRHLRPHL